MPPSTERDVAGVYALWRWVGHLIGVPAELNPAGELTAGPPDSDSRELARAARREHAQGEGGPRRP